MVDLCLAEYKFERICTPHIHRCDSAAGHKLGHQCSCSFYWVDENTIYPNVGKKSGNYRYRVRLTKDGLVFLGPMPDPNAVDDGYRPRGTVTEDDLDRWENTAENQRRAGYRRARAGAEIQRLLHEN